MVKHIQLNGQTYDMSRLGPDGRRTYEMLRYASQRLSEAQQKEAALKRAKNEYITSLKQEIVNKKSGFDLSALLSD